MPIMSSPDAWIYPLGFAIVTLLFGFAACVQRSRRESDRVVEAWNARAARVRAAEAASAKVGQR